MNMNDELQASTACTKCRDAGLDMVAPENRTSGIQPRPNYYVIEVFQ
jgi:hypothetical protein